MKKPLIVILSLLLALALASCDFLSTRSATTTSMETTTSGYNPETTTTTTATTTQDTTSTGTTTTVDPRQAVIVAEFDVLEPKLPTAIIADYVLPEPENATLTVFYAVDGTPLTESVLAYSAPASDVEVILAVTIVSGDYAVTREYPVLLIRDPVSYEAYMTEQSFLEIDQLLTEAMPTVIKSDFTLPELSYSSARITFTTDTSRIYSNRFIFTFPVADTVFTITARVNYKSIIRYFNYDIVMKGIDDLYMIPRLYITTAGNAPVVSRDEYINGTVTMVTYDEDQVATTVMQNYTMQIRGRGNSTFFMPKKSFKIKFTTKTSMLSDYEAKDWVLLANFSDQTLIRNYLAYNFAASLGMEYSPSAKFVDVFLNGEFLGNYMLTDQIEVGPSRVAIDEKSTNADTGYLIEMDKRLLSEPDGIEGIDYFIIAGVPYAIKFPQTDDIYYNAVQYNYIYNYINSVQTTLANRRDYSNLIDEASFIDWFIAQEVFKNVDSGYASVFMYKDKGGLLKMGPVWDFDLSSTNQGHLDYTNRMPEGWYTSLEYKNIWYYYLMRYSTFRLHLQQRWNEIYEIQVAELIASIYPAADAIAKSRYLNFQRWDIIGKNYEWYTSTEVYEAKTYEEQMKLLYAWLDARILWMNEAINDPDFV